MEYLVYQDEKTGDLEVRQFDPQTEEYKVVGGEVLARQILDILQQRSVQETADLEKQFRDSPDTEL